MGNLYLFMVTSISFTNPITEYIFLNYKKEYKKDISHLAEDTFDTK